MFTYYIPPKCAKTWEPKDKHTAIHNRRKSIRLIKVASSSSLSMESVRMESRLCSKTLIAWTKRV